MRCWPRERFRRIHVAIAVAVMVSVPGCASDSSGQHGEAAAVPRSRDVQAGADAFRKFLSAPDVIISLDPDVRDRVLRVFQRVVEAAKQSSFGELAGQLPWEHVIVQNNQKVTGLAFPGGKIVLYTGLLAVSESDDAMAAAIGHLIAKVLMRHQGAAAAGGDGRPEIGGSGAEAKAAGVPTSPEQEKARRQAQREEADYIGMLLCADAGFDPRKAIALYRQLEGPDSPRARKLESRLTEFMSRYEAQQSNHAAPWHE